MAVRGAAEKRNACLKALEFVPAKGTIGLGSGSTVDMLAELIKPAEGNRFMCVSGNAKSALALRGARVLEGIGEADVAFDGADQIIFSGKDRVAIKGAGALEFVLEKKLDYSAKRLFLLVDEEKLAEKGLKRVFIEVEKGLSGAFLEAASKKGFRVDRVPQDNPHLKGKSNEFFYTDSEEPAGGLKRLEGEIEGIRGVLGCGIFSKKRFSLIIGRKESSEVMA